MRNLIRLASLFTNFLLPAEEAGVSLYFSSPFPHTSFQVHIFSFHVSEMLVTGSGSCSGGTRLRFFFVILLLCLFRLVLTVAGICFVR